MPVTVISKRVFKIEQRDKLIPLLQELRKYAKKQKGFISRGTFSSLTDPGEYIVISKFLDLLQREFTCQESAEIGKEIFASSWRKTTRHGSRRTIHGGKRHVMGALSLHRIAIRANPSAAGGGG